MDEAQGLPLYVLEEIRLLLNLETPREKLLQIVLSGQPELEEKLNRPELRQLRQRIALRCNTTPLTLEETHGYIQQRLHIAGANGEPVFVSEAMNAVYFYSHGIPRVMNLLCEHALMNAYVDQIRPVPARMVEQVARKFQFDEVKPFAPCSNSDDSRGPNAIAVQSMLANVLIPALAAAEPGLKEQPQAPVTRVSALVAAASSAFSPNKAPAAPVPDRMEISPLNCGSDAPVIIRDPFRRLAVLKPESSPQKCAPRPLVVDSTKRVPRRFSRTPILILYLSLSRWSAKCRDWCLSIVTSPAWPQMTETLLRWSEQPIRAVRSLYRRSFVGSPAGPRMKAFLLQWLQKPFKLMQMRSATKLAESASVSGRTRANSSPPKRAAVSISRQQMHKTSASRQSA